MIFDQFMVSIIIPTLNAGNYIHKLISTLREQSIVCEIIIIDSSSSDGTPRIAQSHGIKTMRINKRDFNHGGTRNVGGKEATGDLLVYMTHDALPANQFSIENLVSPFSQDDTIGAAYGRQLPRKDAAPIEAHARLFNYPDTSRIKMLDSASLLGIKTAFISNSFAAYRRSALESVGWFPSNTILSEDTYVSAKMLLSGWKIAYCADAQVYHSHNYSYAQEFRRYFDTGVFHAREPWIRKSFGKAEGEGFRYIKSEMAYLLKNGYHLIPAALMRTFFKYLGFRLGIMENKIPLTIKKHLSFNRNFWNNVS